LIPFNGKTAWPAGTEGRFNAMRLGGLFLAPGSEARRKWSAVQGDALAADGPRLDFEFAEFGL
jgi:hypothetical protein